MSENTFATNKKQITVAAFTLVVWDLFEGGKKLRKEEAGTLERGLGPRSPHHPGFNHSSAKWERAW